MIFISLFMKPFVINANSFPVEIVCKNNICSCVKDKVKSFNIDSVIQNLQSYEIIDTAFIACVYHQLAIEHHWVDDYHKAIKYNKKAMRLREKYNDGWLWKSQLNLAYCLNYVNNYKQSIKYLEKAKDQDGYPKRPTDSLLILNLLADGYKEIGELNMAIQFAEKATKINTSKNRINRELIDYSNILIETKDSNNIKNAIICLDSLENIYVAVNDSFNLSRVKNRLGKAYTYLNQLDKSIQYYGDALEMQTDDASRAIYLGNISTAFADKKDFDTALKFLEKSLQLKKSYYRNEINYPYAASYENFADCYLAWEKLDSAFKYYQLALINITGENAFIKNDIFINPTVKDNLVIHSYADIVRVLVLKGVTAFRSYNKNEDKRYLDLANNCYFNAIEFHNKLQKDILSENSRLLQAKNTVGYLEQALEIAYAKQLKNNFDIQATYQFIEKNKATVLLQLINENDALQFANLPGNLLEQEKELKSGISFYKQQLNNAKLDNDTITIIKELEDKLDENKNQYRGLIKNLEENYPKYYRLKYKQNTTKLADIQNHLNNKKAILEYFVGASNIYILSILKNDSKLYKLPKPNDWETIVNDFRSTINAEEVIKDEYTTELFEKFTKSAAQLYKILLEEPLQDLSNSITHLQIIPDRELNYIPFGLLLTNQQIGETEDYRPLPYLLKEKTIGYAYSAALLLETNNDREQDYTFNYAGFAPDFNGKYAPLISTKEAVKRLADKLLSGTAYVDDKATKSNFKKAAEQSKIFQLATHGLLDGNEPLNSKLIFTNGFLEAYELYNMKINAKLGVLSACKTGVGKEAKGEGIMSLSRAFTYAGCNSLVMSLWSIEDDATANIVEDFFKNLKKGKLKDEALRNAKLNYLEKAKQENTHPIYWAGLVQSGDTSSIDFDSFRYYWLFLPFLLLLSLGVGYTLSKGKN